MLIAWIWLICLNSVFIKWIEFPNERQEVGIILPVYHKHRLIHIHIPKTAGTAIGGNFEEVGDMNWNADCWCGQEHIGGRWYEFQHLTMTEFRELSAGRFDAYSSFSVVRNPYTRLLSDYLWFQLHNPVNSSFEMFVRAIPADLDRNWQNYIAAANKQQANYFIHLRPQNHYITDGEGRSLVDNILRFEQLGQEFYEFSKLPESSGNSIKTPRARDINPYFDRPLIELTNRLYEKDFEMFSYPIL